MNFSYAKESACIVKLSTDANARIPCTWMVMYGKT